MTSPAAFIARDRHAVRRGWTLIELVVALALIGLLSALAYPSLRTTMLRIQRSDAVTTLGRVQLLQQRYRSSHPRFATLAELGLPALSGNGRYALNEQPPSATGFAIVASARGSQAADQPCRHLALQVDGAETRWSSGADADLANGDADNRRCWGHR